jgi:hypothetical protein
MYKATYWHRWVAGGHIRGLPVELGEMVMLSYLEEKRLVSV